jgi:hypothetical protein
MFDVVRRVLSRRSRVSFQQVISVALAAAVAHLVPSGSQAQSPGCVMQAKASLAALAWASPGERQVQAAACMSAPMPRPR